MAYPYSSFYLEARWSKLKVAEYFDSGLDGFPAIEWQKVCARRCEDQRRAPLGRKLFIAGRFAQWLQSQRRAAQPTISEPLETQASDLFCEMPRCA